MSGGKVVLARVRQCYTIKATDRWVCTVNSHNPKFLNLSPPLLSKEAEVRLDVNIFSYTYENCHEVWTYNTKVNY